MEKKKEKVDKSVKAYKYYSMGLNSKEIAKLLDVSYRTIQAYMSKYKWSKNTKPNNLKFECLKLYELGKTYIQIADELNICRASVYNYLKQTRTYQQKIYEKKGKFLN